MTHTAITDSCKGLVNRNPKIVPTGLSFQRADGVWFWTSAGAIRRAGGDPIDVARKVDGELCARNPADDYYGYVEFRALYGMLVIGKLPYSEIYLKYRNNPLIDFCPSMFGRA